MRRPNVRRVRVPKTAELIAGQVRRDIVLGVLAEDDPLPPESDLMEQFGVSRPTLREAYRILESEGLLSVRRGAHGGGRVHVPKEEVAARYAALVLQFRGTSLAEIYEARTMLEAPCAALTAARRSNTDLKLLRVANESAEAAADEPAIELDFHHHFHALVIEIAGNRTIAVLANMIDSILDQADLQHVEARAGTEAERAASRRAQRTHSRLIDLIDAKDTVGAERLWRMHLDEAAKHVLQNVGVKTILEVIE